MSGLSAELEKPLDVFPASVKAYVHVKAQLCRPDRIYVCDGSERERDEILAELLKLGTIKKLSKYQNCYLARTDPADVARVESKTVICTKNKNDTVPKLKEGATGKLNIWISPEDLDHALNERFPGCMVGRTMYVIPFNMGPVGGPLSKIGIELTDSPYVVLSMRVMTRMGQPVIDLLKKNGNVQFIKALHSCGLPKPEKRKVINGWPCNPDLVIVSHIPDRNEICSFGSSYGGNSLLGKKCFALRIGSYLAKREGWLAEHMLILGVKTPSGKQHYICAAFPSACGKTNLAMLQPTLPGFEITCVGDDIAWMKFDDNGVLRAINPESGFFGVAPGTSHVTNPNAMVALEKNTIFTNVAETSDGGFFWEGLEDEVKNRNITDWTNKEWKVGCGRPAAHPNSRFCAPANQCPIIDPAWENPEGVPIDAIVFGGRRPEGVPLVMESFSWQHGVFLGASMRSESTAAAEYKGKTIMHDPFAMRPFFGYNFGNYCQHWLDFEKKPNLKLPKIFHVNWFRKDDAGKFMWPGFCENLRVVDWMLKRCEGTVSAVDTVAGRVPKPQDINVTGLNPKPNMEQLLSVTKKFWAAEADELREYFDEQVPEDFPPALREELDNLAKRTKA